MVGYNASDIYLRFTEIDDDEFEELIKYLEENYISYEGATDVFIDNNKEITRLNNIIDKAIHCINLNQENSGALSYENCKRVRGILKGDEFDLRMFEEQLKELKEGKYEEN